MLQGGAEEVHGLLGPEIHRFGGKIDRFRNDGLVAFFGIPVAHEDDQERAVLAALGLQQAIRATAEELKAREGIELQLRVGASTGEVITAGFGGGPAQGQDTVIGAAIALAEGLATAAEPGNVLVSGSTYRRVR